MYAQSSTNSSFSINLQGYSLYIVTCHSWLSGASYRASGCGAVQVAYTVQASTMCTFICSSSGTLNLSVSGTYLHNVHITGVR